MTRGWQLLRLNTRSIDYLVAFILVASTGLILFAIFFAVEPIGKVITIGLGSLLIAFVIWKFIDALAYELSCNLHVAFLIPFYYVCKFDRSKAPEVYYAARDNLPPSDFTFVVHADKEIYGLFRKREDAVWMKMLYG
jgi:hypothetical protein